MANSFPRNCSRLCCARAISRRAMSTRVVASGLTKIMGALCRFLRRRRQREPNWSPCSSRQEFRSSVVSRSEEHTSELRHGYISYAVFCLKKKKKKFDFQIYEKKKQKIINTNFKKKE